VRSGPFLLFVAIVAVTAAACTRGATPETTVSTRPLLTTISAPPETSTSSSTTLPPLTGQGPVDYQIVRREPLGDLGDAVSVLVAADATTLSDLDLFDIITDVVDRFPPIYEVYVVDDPRAADLVFVDAPTPEEQAVLDEHLLARLVDGYRIVYEGPFADVGSTIIGS